MTERKWWPKIDHWWAAAMALSLVPVLALLPLGLLWLYRNDWLFVWFAAFALCGLLAYLAQYVLRARERRMLEEGGSRLPPEWTRTDASAWEVVEKYAREVRPQDWPIESGDRLVQLGEQTLERVARHFHPEVEEPLLELTVPHALLIIERASADLRHTISENVPFSHRLTLGTLARAYRWRSFGERLLVLYRAGRWLMNPSSALLGEAWKLLRGQGYALAQDEFYRWFLQEYVRKVGRYAIDLYSGRLLLADEDPQERPTEASARDLKTLNQSEAAGEPLRILVAGRANAGKSSLVNALFGEVRNATDSVPGTTREITSLALTREGLEFALVLDSPGIETLELSALLEAAHSADMVVWVSAAHRPDRQQERTVLDALRGEFTNHLERSAPPLIVALTHIDLLRPARDWDPPYDLRDPSSPKGQSIQAALVCAAQDLAVPPVDLIPVCLLPGRLYNVADALWSGLLEHLDDAQRVRLLRCREARRQEEDWGLLRRQLVGAGRFLLALPKRAFSSARKS